MTNLGIPLTGSTAVGFNWNHEGIISQLEEMIMLKMKSAVCDDDHHELCSGKFYRYDDTSRKKIMELCSCSCHYKKKRG